MISHLGQGFFRRRQAAPNPVVLRVAAVALTLLVLMAVSVAIVPHAEAAPAAVTSNGTYVVRAGDTLNSIAARYGVSPSTLARVNGISNPNRIYIGQRLVISGSAAPAPQPKPSTTASSGGVYIVQRGDTLAKIAARYRTTIAALMSLNGIRNPNVIWVGQRLRVGKSSGTVSPAPAKPPVSGGSGKWIDINLSKQRLTAYQGNTPVFSALISGGLPRTPTVVGRFKINTKLTSTRMRGPGYDLPNVPYTMYFYKGYAIHGTYWHNNFGRPMSHGCVNMRTSDAAWLFNWTPMGTTVVTHW
jgi:LysM repeat protein